MVFSPSARRLAHGEISACPTDVYGASVSKQTVSTVTDKVTGGMAEWLRTEDRINPGDLHPAAQRPGPARGRRRLTRRQPGGLDPVRTRVPTLAEQVPQLRLGHLLAGCETKNGQAPPHPPSGRDPGLLLRPPERCTRRGGGRHRPRPGAGSTGTSARR